jgi:tetratricopeptide (TPR) repeat protein
MHISAESVLVVRHQPGSDPPSFEVVRLRDGKASQPAVLPSPFGFPVEGRPNSDLMRELQWYLEIFLDYPFPPETDHADRVLKALRDWGEQAFQSLFGDRAAGRMFDAATADDYSRLHLQISSDDPQVLSWPWEALRDPELGVLAHTCQIERRLNTDRDPQPVPESLPKDCVNILLVVARPYGRQDVKFRSIARPLVELIEKKKLPANVELLRPPTFENLRQHLREQPGFYHILHFDGHGAYSAAAPGSIGHTFQGPEGKLVFETDDAEPDPITAEKLSSLLRECAVPGVVLNACQSAMVSGDSHDPFSSVATALLRAGMRDVVAMAYSLYVSGAQQFLPAFYRRLFEDGSVAVAVRAGRQQMWEHDKRTCVRGEFPLQDWLLPVLYQQDPLSFSFVADAQKQFVPRASKLPEELRSEKNPYGFVGRDSAILELERAMRRPPAGILIQGLGGVGKTTLARGFLQWLDQTGGLDKGCFWLSFQEIRSAEYVFNRLGDALFGGNFPVLPMDQKIQSLKGVLREHRFLLVWDNFESAAGISGTAIEAKLPEPDRKLLAQFLEELHGGATKVIITSRSPEDWLGPQRRYVLPLGGLDREERWEYCNAILRDLGKSINRNDRELVELMDFLGGHPQAMRAILPRLEKLSAAQVLAALRSNLADLKLGGDGDEAKLHATLNFVEQSLPQELRPLLTLVGMHEGFVDADYLEAMAKEVDAAWTRGRVDALMQALATAGLLRDIGQATYEMHPLLTSYLRTVSLPSVRPEDRDSWARAFVDVMGSVANRLAPLEHYQQRVPFHLHGQNLHYALSEAEKLEMSTDVAALTQSLAVFAQNTRNLAAAARLYERLAGIRASLDNSEGEAAAYHQLGMVAQERRDFAAAERWYRRSLAIKEKLGDELFAATTYHQLGIVALVQHDFAAADQWCHKALAIRERLSDEQGAAQTYHQLGYVAQEQRDFAAAEKWYHKSLAVWEKLGDEHTAASTYHQLGIVAQKQRDLAAAEQWYRKSLAIKERRGDEYGAATTYGQLGLVSGQQGNYLECGGYFIKCMIVFLRTVDRHLSAQTSDNFMIFYKKASPEDQKKLETMWKEAALGDLPSLD